MITEHLYPVEPRRAFFASYLDVPPIRLRTAASQPSVMISFSALLSAAALTSTYSVAQAQRDDLPLSYEVRLEEIQALPWDGRADDLTVEKITDKYSTDIFTMRNDPSHTVAEYVTIDQKGRPEGYNCDEGVINIGADENAIFQDQFDKRRSELVQFVATSQKGPSYFRTSFKKDEAFLNDYTWQLIFDKLHFFEIRVDASLSSPKLIYLNNGTWDPKWETKFVPGTWYNFGVALSAAPSGGHKIEFYVSEGEKDLKLTATHSYPRELPADFEYHIGLLTVSDDGSPVEMVKEQEIVTYNGVSVTAGVPTTADIAGSPACK